MVIPLWKITLICKLFSWKGRMFNKKEKQIEKDLDIPCNVFIITTTLLFKHLQPTALSLICPAKTASVVQLIEYINVNTIKATITSKIPK